MLTLTSPVETFAHRWPAGAKLAGLCAFTYLLFALQTPVALAVAALLTAALIAVAGGRFARESLRALRPLAVFLGLIAAWHLWQQDAAGIPVLLRLVTAVAAANFVTMTTRLSDMISVIQTLARPLSPLIRPATLALAIALVIRFLPVMLARSALIAEAWRARSPRRPGWRILLPGTLAALDDADRVAEALRARGGSG